MAEAVAEPQTAAPEQKNEAPTNGNAETSNGVAEKSNGDAAHNGKIEKNIADGKDGDQRHPDRRNPDSRDDRDDERKDKRNHDRNDNRRGGGRGGGRGRGFRGGGRGRGRGGGGDGGFRGNNHGRNVRTRFQREEESSDATEIRRQVEFYFSDSNLPIDRFLLEETGGPANKPFPLKTIHNFKRMRHFQPFSAVVEAVKGSTFLEVNDKDEVYRKVPLDERFTLDVAKNNELLTSSSMARSIYAKGFGKEEEKTAFDIEEFFQPYGVKSVRLRRQEDGTFKGSVFVEFEDEESAQQFLEMDEKPNFNDQELQIMSKKAYVDMKSQAILEGTVMPKSPSRKSYHNGSDRRDRHDRHNGGFKRKRHENEDEDDGDKDNWRERRNKFQDRGRGRGRGRGGQRGGDRDASRSASPIREQKKEETETKKEEAAEAIQTDAPTEIKKEAAEEIKTDAATESKEPEKTEA